MRRPLCGIAIIVLFLAIILSGLFNFEEAGIHIVGDIPSGLPDFGIPEGLTIETLIAVAPGAILWPEAGMDELSKQRLISRTPLRQAGNPEDIARTILFLVADAPYITGQVIAVDGGRSVQQ